VLIHSEIGVTLLRKNRLSSDAFWHLAVAERVLKMRVLSLDRAFRRDWYLAVTAEMHVAKQQLHARSILSQARRDLPNSPELLFASGAVDESIARLDAPALPAGRTPEGVIATVNRVRHEYLEGARAHFRAAARLAPEDARIQLHLGRVLVLLDDGDAAEHLRRAADAPDVETRFIASMFLGGFYQQRKRPADAVKWYEQAAALVPGRTPAAVALSQVYQQLGRSDEARRVLAEAARKQEPKPGFGPWQNYPVELEPDLRKVWLALRARVND
jgi:tetratricopeptide (TPR) repeat protein